MDKGMELLLSKLDEKLQQQTLLITTSVTKNVMEALDQKMKMITEENNVMKEKISQLEQKLSSMEIEKRKNNLIFFGINNIEKSEYELVEYIKYIITNMGIDLNNQEINKVYRIGKWATNKNRPIVVSFTTLWKKHVIMKNKSKLPRGIYIKEDYSKEVLEKRKQLQPIIEEEKRNGNIAFLVHDKIVVKKPRDNSREKRKREVSGSPNSSTQKKINTTNDANHILPTTPSKVTTRPNNLLNFIERKRSASISEIPKN
ncbi:hypothetical protein O3G_MSEX000344 [Manduca sexta]|nr:hypothetical protein O3G_MSEX000344 [Manduca sexta]